MIKIKDYKHIKKGWIDCLIKSYILDIKLPRLYQANHCKFENTKQPIQGYDKVFKETHEMNIFNWIRAENKLQDKFSKSEEVSKLKSQLIKLWGFGFTILPHELQEFRKNKTLKLEKL